MSEQQQVNICQHNQTGFCKFREKCQNKHENTLCENTEHCGKDSCSKRHPKVCRNFSNNGICRHKEKCAYKHVQSENQTDLNEQIKQGLLKHEEVNTRRNLIQYMALELSKNVSKEVTVIETSEENLEDAKEIEDAHCEIKVKCEKCEFTCDKVITLNKHMNTKHMQEKVKNYTGNKKGNTEKFLCDKCQLSFKKKRDLTKHMDSVHKISEGSTELGNKSSTNENKESACKCTHDTVCDYCLETDGWVY